MKNCLRNIAICGDMAYKLDLPAHLKVHPMFNASQLKLIVGSALTSTYFSSKSCDVLVKEPECVIDMKLVERQGRAAVMILVKWKKFYEDEATWKFVFDLVKKFPTFEKGGFDIGISITSESLLNVDKVNHQFHFIESRCREALHTQKRCWKVNIRIHLKISEFIPFSHFICNSKLVTYISLRILLQSLILVGYSIDSMFSLESDFVIYDIGLFEDYSFSLTLQNCM